MIKKILAVVLFALSGQLVSAASVDFIIDGADALYYHIEGDNKVLELPRPKIYLTRHVMDSKKAESISVDLMAGHPTTRPFNVQEWARTKKLPILEQALVAREKSCVLVTKNLSQLLRVQRVVDSVIEYFWFRNVRVLYVLC